MKIGFFPDYLLNWQGGRDIFAMFFDSLSMALEPEDEIRILSIGRRRDTRPWRVARVAKHLVSHFSPDLNWAKKEFARPTRARDIAGIVGRKVNIEILSELSRGGLAYGYSPDVMWPWCGLKAPGVHVPCVGYIPDFQHYRMPKFFSAEDIVERDTLFAGMLRELPVVIVTSEDARSDLHRYFPRISSKIVTLPFAASPLPDWLSVDGTAAREKYRLPLKYFLCSNQFWQHKNHGVVLEALSLARAEGRPIFMVFTGAMEDYRAPAYASHLMSQVQNLGVQAIASSLHCCQSWTR